MEYLKATLKTEIRAKEVLISSKNIVFKSIIKKIKPNIVHTQLAIGAPKSVNKSQHTEVTLHMHV